MNTRLQEVGADEKGRMVKSIQIELPEKLAYELDMLVQQGWFSSEEEAICFALLEFLRRHRLELLAQFQRDDIAWALRQKDAVR